MKSKNERLHAIKMAAQPRRFDILKIILRQGDQSPIELSDRLDIEYSSIGHSLLLMQNLGMLESFRKPGSKNVYYRLTKWGRNVAFDLVDLIDDWR